MSTQTFISYENILISTNTLSPLYFIWNNNTCHSTKLFCMSNKLLFYCNSSVNIDFIFYYHIVII